MNSEKKQQFKDSIVDEQNTNNFPVANLQGDIGNLHQEVQEKTVDSEEDFVITLSSMFNGLGIVNENKPMLFTSFMEPESLYRESRKHGRNLEYAAPEMLSSVSSVSSVSSDGAQTNTTVVAEDLSSLSRDQLELLYRESRKHGRNLEYAAPEVPSFFYDTESVTLENLNKDKLNALFVLLSDPVSVVKIIEDFNHNNDYTSQLFNLAVQILGAIKKPHSDQSLSATTDSSLEQTLSTSDSGDGLLTYNGSIISRIEGPSKPESFLTSDGLTALLDLEIDAEKAQEKDLSSKARFKL